MFEATKKKNTTLRRKAILSAAAKFEQFKIGDIVKKISQRGVLKGTHHRLVKAKKSKSKSKTKQEARE